MEFKKTTLLLAGVAASLNGMELVKEQKVEEQTIDWQRREKEYTDWTVFAPLNEQKYWVALKAGLENGAIKYEPSAHESLDMKLKEGFIAYVGPVKVEGGNAILLYPSPLWMYAHLVNNREEATDVYAVSTKNDVTFKALAFKIKEKASLPKGLEINEAYLPNWNSSETVLWHNKWGNKEGANLASRFEKMMLKNNNESESSSSSDWDSSEGDSTSDSDSFDCPNLACGISAYPRTAGPLLYPPSQTDKDEEKNK